MLKAKSVKRFFVFVLCASCVVFRWSWRYGRRVLYL